MIRSQKPGLMRMGVDGRDGLDKDKLRAMEGATSGIERESVRG